MAECPVMVTVYTGSRPLPVSFMDATCGFESFEDVLAHLPLFERELVGYDHIYAFNTKTGASMKIARCDDD